MELAKNNTENKTNQKIFVNILRQNVLMFFVELAVSNIDLKKFTLKKMYVHFQQLNVKVF